MPSRGLLRPARGRPGILWAVLLGFLLVFASLVVTIPSGRWAWGLIWGASAALTLVCLVLARSSRTSDLALAAVLTLLTIMSTLPVRGQPEWLARAVLTSGLIFAATTAVTAVARTFPDAGIRWSRPPRAIHVLVALGAGLALGVVNLALSGVPVVPRWRWDAWLLVLSPGIVEEVAFRAVFYAFAVAVLGGPPRGRAQSLVVWSLMIVPHAIVHLPTVYAASPVNGIVSTLVLGVVFGLPFAVLQRRVDLASAMVAHGTVDLVRFMMIGLP